MLPLSRVSATHWLVVTKGTSANCDNTCKASVGLLHNMQYISQQPVSLCECGHWDWAFVSFSIFQHDLPACIKLCCTATKQHEHDYQNSHNTRKSKIDKNNKMVRRIFVIFGTLSSSASIKYGLGYPQPIMSR